MPLSLCIAGCGGFARTFVKAIRSFSGLKPSDTIDLFFASRDKSKARAYCRMFGGEDSFGSYEEAAADPRVQAIYLCVPHSLHVGFTLLAAGFSKHILVEKPIARTLDEGHRMITAAREVGVKLMVAENYRYMPAVQKSRELIRHGAIGTVRFVQIQQETNFKPEGWRTSREMMGGGVLIDGIHAVDTLLDLGGEPEQVYASNLPQTLHDLDGEDGIVLMARLKGGATGLVNHAWGISRRSWRQWVAVSGTKGRIYFRPGSLRLTLETGDGKKTHRFPEDGSGIGHMVKEFRDCILDDRPPLTSGEEGLRDLKVVLSAYESASRRMALDVE